MGRRRPRNACDDEDCGCPHKNISSSTKKNGSQTKYPEKPISLEQALQEQTILDLFIIGAGPHALSLLLRLIEPDADLLADKERHLHAEYSVRQRPIRDVFAHLRRLSRGRPSVTLKRPKRKKKWIAEGASPNPPSISLSAIYEKTIVMDHHGGWLTNWNKHFQTLKIPQLRSLVSAHADPYDHRSLEFYAEKTHQEEQLIYLPHLKKRDGDFRGPYEAPSTMIFQEFHEMLIQSYGLKDMVQKGFVSSVLPIPDPLDSQKAMFEVTFKLPGIAKLQTLKTRRVVCAMGPKIHSIPAFWESTLRKELSLENRIYPSDKIVHSSEIVSFLQTKSKKMIPKLLIVGGGITSAQLAILAAKSTWCQSVTIFQRSRILERQFDIETKWMGPKRGSLLDEFWSQSMSQRANLLQAARKGGSIPPEVLKVLVNNSKIKTHEEIQISNVEWTGKDFVVSMDTGESESFDMIWLATGSENSIDSFPILSNLSSILPIQIIQGLPVLSKDLSWKLPFDMNEKEEEPWKKMARKQVWCMGSLAGLELGPDALNLIGGRHGAVRVATALRRDFNQVHDVPFKTEDPNDGTINL